jgi:hypothetical protein
MRNETMALVEIDSCRLAGITGGTDPKPAFKHTLSQVKQQEVFCQRKHGVPVLIDGKWFQPELAAYSRCMGGGEDFMTDKD